MLRSTLTALLMTWLTGTAFSQNLIDFHPAATFGVGGKPAGGVLFDFTGDGSLDLAISSDNPNKIEFFANQGDGTFGAPVALLTGNETGPEGLAAGDFNADGHLDLVVALFGTSSVQLVLGDGAGNFTLGPSATVGVEPSVVVTADLNGDGFVDAAVNNRVSGDMSVILNNGAGGLLSAVTYPVGDQTRCIAVGDFSGDGVPDLAVSARDSRRVRLFKNIGGGAFQIFRDLSMGSILKPQGVAMADLDGDGALDLVTASSGTTPGQEHPSVFLQNNGGRPNIWVGPVNGTALPGVEPTGIAAADFDLDGLIDVATANAATNNVSANKNGGIGIFTIPNVFAVGSNPSIQVLLTGDIDRNGAPDLVTINEDSEDVSVLLNRMQGTVSVRSPNPGRGPHLLHPASPNPLTSSTSLDFDLPVAASVHMAIYDVTGRSVRTLERRALAAGRHRVTWDGTADHGGQLPAGVYLARLSAGDRVETQRIVLAR
ncbi:MAG: T9SS type A sorting domain-containing protein [Candidatus Eisenbacteria bacterium]|uniref:T9SS type A sorting domain-containing protein n=1 Tax=Eiseniibacteriota bacterium TaxID=2212470 RepID=A0A849SHC9_UNCEI|nr:T9SS type A sorting domain-containing protein [Candidatus Eisenbacteria bacterium]